MRLSSISTYLPKSLPHLYPSTSASIVSSLRQESTASTRRQSTAVIPPLSAQFPTNDRVVETKKKLEGHFAVVDDCANVQEKKPLVLMLGWGGCTDKQLSKFSDVWLEKGFSVVRYSPPMEKVLSVLDYPQFVNPLYSEISQNLQNRDILLHLFSMNGCNAFVVLYDLLNRTPEGQKILSSIKGMVVDSGPADVLPKKIAFAIALSVYPPNKKDVASNAARALLYGMLTARLNAQRFKVWLRDLLGKNTYPEWYAYYKMKEMTAQKQLPTKQMYFYSKKDFVCDAKSIDEFIESQGPEVEIKRFKFDDSPHVNHFRKHPELYRKECEKFADEILVSKL
ncbi:unnamed protein product [Bursaphelenchus xylophilus]|uniref:(pine wood nematode) hypothetical protein n=1 Tax=Bursaphelenchus xylophilus TaxID=6326 RepID=A0A1I7RHU7_BURXY|nr:unnamed protein product [Bursaphelenchus xylophilus]CAG9115367.1 unnamed protein product [Bursaphelenchus xylophilus]